MALELSIVSVAAVALVTVRVPLALAEPVLPKERRPPIVWLLPSRFTVIPSRAVVNPKTAIELKSPPGLLP